MCCLRRADKSHTLPGVQQICIRKSGEPRTAVPPEKYIAKTMEIGPCRRMQRRTYPFAFVILSPGSKIGHTPRKNPSAPMGAAATSRINAYRGWCRTPVLHQPFAAKKYDTTIYRKLQVFFQQIVKYFLKNSAFCRNSLSRPFPAFPLWGDHLLP